MDIKDTNTSHSLFMVLLGVFSTTPIITIPIGPIDIQVFRVLFYGTIIYMAINAIHYGYIRIGRYILKLDYWLVLALFSCIIGGIVFTGSYSTFSMTALSYLPKVTAFLVFSIIWATQKPDKAIKNSEAVIKGIMIGCTLNLIWASIDAAGFYITGKSINNILFSGYIARHNIRYQMLSLIDYRTGLFRAAGFNSDPAQIGFVAPIIVYYGFHERDIRYVGLATLGIIASASTTALVSSLIIAFIYIVQTKNLRYKLTPTKIYRFISISFLLLIVVFIYDDRIIAVISRAITRFLGRLSSSQFRSISANKRVTYILYVPVALFHIGIMGLIGTGFGTSSYGYIVDDTVLGIIGTGNSFPYDPENTYIAYLLDTGIIGFCIFMHVMVTLIKHYKSCINGSPSKTEIAEYACVLSTALSMMFYHYILFTPQMLILIIGLTMVDSNNSNT